MMLLNENGKAVVRPKKVSDFTVGMPVVYIPEHLLMEDQMIKDENLGIVTKVNDLYVFVRFLNKYGSNACRPNDLFFLNNRPDLIEKLDWRMAMYRSVKGIGLRGGSGSHPLAAIGKVAMAKS